MMKTLVRRKPKNQPCKSPSPDVANRSIIKNTTIEVEDIRIKFKKAQEKQLKFEIQSSISHIPSDNASNQAKYRQLYDEFNRLKNQNKTLIEQNKLLNQQNGRFQVPGPSLGLGPGPRNTNFNPISGGIISKRQHQVLREKLVLVTDQNKKIEHELIREKGKVEQLSKDIENLRIQKEFLQDPLKNQAGRNQDYIPQQLPLPSSALNTDEERKFMLYSSNMLSNYQNKVNSYLNDLNSRINKVEMMERILKEKQERWEKQNRSNKTPISKPGFNYWATSTGTKIDTQIKDYPRSQQRPIPGFQQPSSPFRAQDSVIDKIDNFNLQENIKLKDSEILQLNLQKQKLNAIIRDYEKNSKVIIPTPALNDQKNILQSNEIDALKEDLKYTKEQNENYHHSNQVLSEKLSYLQENLEHERRDMENKLSYQQKIIKQFERQAGQFKQCFRCVQFEQESIYLKQLLKQTKQKQQRNYQKWRNSQKLKDSEIFKLKRQKQRLNTTINDYEKKTAMIVPTPTFNHGDVIPFKTVAFLQEDLKHVREQNEEYHHLNQILSLKLSQLQGNLEYERRDMENKLQYLQNIIKQFERQTGQSKQCFRCIQLEQENIYLKQLLKQTKQQYETNYQKLKNSITQMAKNQRIKKLGESKDNQKFKQLEVKYQRLAALNNELSDDIKNYLSMLEYIKNILHVNDIEDLLSQNSGIYTEVEAAILLERERHAIEIKEYQYKIQTKDYEIAELEREFKLKAAEVDLLKNQIQKLKVINMECQSTAFKKISSQMIQSKHAIFFANSHSILDKVKTGSEKLEILYQKVCYFLSQMNNAPPLDMSSSIIDP